MIYLKIMENNILYNVIKSYNDFPKKGIVFRDVLPLLEEPEIFSKVINNLASHDICKSADALIAIDARGFLFASPVSLKISKPLIVARKPGKLPGSLYTKSYSLEYGENSLSIQKDLIQKYNSFAIIDDLIATGGTVGCLKDILYELDKKISGVLSIIELKELNARSKFDFPIHSEIAY